MANGLILQDLRVLRGGTVMVALDRAIAPGDVLSVMGPSGVGKSTLLAAISGALPPDFTQSGEIWLNGREIGRARPEERRVGILFQDDLLFPHLSVGENLAFGLRAGGTVAQRRTQVSAALAEIELAGFETRDPATLSGGQKARVALMRMLLSEPEALLLDEAFAGLDADLRAQMRTLVFSRARDRRLPVLMVTHDADDAHAAGGPIVRLG